MDIEKFVANFNGSEEQDKEQKWSEVIQPKSAFLITGDVGTGKSALCFYLMERFGKKYGLIPTILGFPRDQQNLLPDYFEIVDAMQQTLERRNVILLVDEADTQIPLHDQKQRDYVLTILNSRAKQNQIFLLSYHYPRLVLGTYLPSFDGFLLKRPPYLLEFASKESKEITNMMQKAEERFSELPSSDDIVKNTYVVAPRIRWQGMLANPLPLFWSQELREVMPKLKQTLDQSKTRQYNFLQKENKMPQKEPGIPKYAHITEIMKAKPKRIEEPEWLEIVKGVEYAPSKGKLSLEILTNPERVGIDPSKIPLSQEQKEKYQYSLQVFKVPLSDKTINMMKICDQYGEGHIRELCVREGLSDTGHSIVLCARLIAKAMQSITHG